MIELLKNQVQTIFGKRQLGKTTLADKLTANERRLIALDPEKKLRSGLIVETAQQLQQYYESAQPSHRAICRLETWEEIEGALEYARSQGNLTLLVDEVNKVHSVGRSSKWFENILDFGANNDITVIATARRPMQVKRLLTALSNRVVTFRTSEPNDLDFFKSIGFDVEAVRNLPDFEYLYVDI